MEFTLQELMAIRDGLGTVQISNVVIAAIDKIDSELRQRGYERKTVALPKAKYQKNTHYKYEYVQIKERH
jgi:hypothetical protein